MQEWEVNETLVTHHLRALIWSKRAKKWLRSQCGWVPKLSPRRPPCAWPPPTQAAKKNQHSPVQKVFHPPDPLTGEEMCKEGFHQLHSTGRSHWSVLSGARTWHYKNTCTDTYTVTHKIHTQKQTHADTHRHPHINTHRLYADKHTETHSDTHTTHTDRQAHKHRHTTRDTHRPHN